MPLRIHLLRVSLSYADGMVLHTASSGAVPALDELRLVVERDGTIAALGASRINIAYLSGHAPETLVEASCRVVRHLNWRQPWASFVGNLDTAYPGLATPVRVLFEMTAADGAAREAGKSLTNWLGGTPRPHMPTNQTLFWSDDDTMLRRARAYVSRGFMDLKLRIGFGNFSDDLRRLYLLRDQLGPRVLLSVDANGSWDAASAEEQLAALAALGLQYIEQPLPAAAREETAALSRVSPVPIMLDESLDSDDAIEWLIATRAAPFAHLKLAKFGGLDGLMRAGRRLLAADIGVMIGQMNEGSVSTAAAAHAAAALDAPLCELYGADGLAADPAGALRYVGGSVFLPPGPGIGLQHHEISGHVLWETTQ